MLYVFSVILTGLIFEYLFQKKNSPFCFLLQQKTKMDLLLLIFSFRLVLPSFWSIFCRHFLTCLQYKLSVYLFGWPISIHDEASIIAALLEEPTFLTATSTHGPTLWAVLFFIFKKYLLLAMYLCTCKYGPHRWSIFLPFGLRRLCT